MRKAALFLFFAASLSSAQVQIGKNVQIGSGTGSGTVTSVSAAGAQGVTVSVANPNSTPALTIGLGAITPSSVSTGSVTDSALTSGNSVVAGAGGLLANGPILGTAAQINTGTSGTTLCLLTGNCIWTGTHTWGSSSAGLIIAPGGSGSIQGVSGGAQTWQIGNATGQAQFGPLFVLVPNAATSTVNFNSPLFSIEGSCWNGTAPIVDTWMWQNVLAAGTNPQSTYTLSHTGCAGGGSGEVSIPFEAVIESIDSTNIDTETFNATTSANVNILNVGFGGNATSGGNQNSPASSLLGSYWNGTAPLPDAFIWTNVIGSGTNPTSTYTLSHTGATGGASVSLPFPVAIGGVTNATGLQVATVATCIGAGTQFSSCTVSVPLSVNTPTTAYHPDCHAENMTGSGAVVTNIVSQTTSSFTASVMQTDPSAITGGTIACTVTWHP